ncbi:hypothetical protein QBC43DRAFT_311542 [Cladorrhinum sp. PSN259]|nr:hypothetical protein QBC43DRAFT_311542 [Cladorrhinum sp. PSN259]
MSSPPANPDDPASCSPSLSQLPNEIWLMIFNYLPSTFFQQDIRRLSLSKQWHTLAFTTFYPQIEFTPRVISRLVNRKTKNLDKSRTLLKKSLRSVNIVLQGIPPTPPCDENHPNRVFNTASNLRRFALMLDDFQELKCLKFVAGHANQVWKGDPDQGDYLPLRSIEPYLSLLSSNVSSMDLDLCGTNVTHVGSGRSGDAVHFCCFLRPLLTRLVSLKVRLRCICREALKPVGREKITVREVSVNLFLGRVSEVSPKLNSTRLCVDGVREQKNRWTGWEGWVEPVDEVRKGLLRLVGKMENPIRAEMVHLDFGSGEIHHWDALSGKGGRCVRDENERVFDKFWTQKKMVDGHNGGSCFQEEESDITDSGLGSDSELVDTDDGF